jgi:hypothetical protein
MTRRLKRRKKPATDPSFELPMAIEDKRIWKKDSMTPPLRRSAKRLALNPPILPKGELANAHRAGRRKKETHRRGVQTSAGNRYVSSYDWAMI